MENLVIRKATVEDAEGKGYVHYQSWMETYTSLFSEDYIKSLKLEKFVKLAKDYPENTYVALMNNKIVGYSCYLKSRDEDLDDTGEIMAIYLLKKYQGLGIGKKLLEVCYKELRKYSKLSLWVLGMNKQAIAFYEHHGFIADGKTKIFHNQEIIRMVKAMKDSEVFSFVEFGELSDKEVKLQLDERVPENKEKGFVTDVLNKID